MNITLHIGAHRSASTSFQRHLRHNTTLLARQQVEIWGPRQTRKSLFVGLFPGVAAAKGRAGQDRAAARVQQHLRQARAKGRQAVLVSDENMIGSVRHCLRRRMLYPAIGERMARVAEAFGGQVDRVVLVIRSQDAWWSSAIAYGVGRGHPLPSGRTLAQIVATPRTWRDVITDLAHALPGTRIDVLRFEDIAGRPDVVFDICAPGKVARATPDIWLNPAPELEELRRLVAERGGDTAALPAAGRGRWQPFTPEQSARLREDYADDLFWLTAGADGLATLTEDRRCERTGTNPSAAAYARGYHHDDRQGHLAAPG